MSKVLKLHVPEPCVLTDDLPGVVQVAYVLSPDLVRNAHGLPATRGTFASTRAASGENDTLSAGLHDLHFHDLRHSCA